MRPLLAFFNHCVSLVLFQLTKADKANDDGGSGGDGSCIRPVVFAVAWPTVEATVEEEDVPCLVLLTMG